MYPEYKPNTTVALAKPYDAAKNQLKIAKSDDGLTLLPIRGNVYMISGAGANITHAALSAPMVC